MYTIHKDDQLLLRTDDERSVALFFFGVMWGGGEPIEFELLKDGKLTIKTLIINKYFPKT